MKKNRIPFLTVTLIMIFITTVYGQEKKQPPQYAQGPAPVTIHQISKSVYDIRGGAGANSALIIGNNSATIIDAKMTDQDVRDMLEAVKKITDKPIKRLILTHCDMDHVNGIPGIPEKTDIIAHVNSLKNMEKANEQAQVKIRLPNITFTDQMTLSDDGAEIRLLYFGPAHTDGNIVIYIPDERIAIIGDLFFKGMDPLIHKQKNGTSEGFVNVLQKIIELNADKYLSGHAEPATKADIETLRNSIMEKREKVGEMIKAGKTLDEVKQAFNIPAGQSRWPSLVEIIYGEMKQP
ncbi:MAG: MBL fold metallo-hydrolase [Desulfatiglans sp.]|nr:MBL fold metallo-hydrolase [Desulfatiglans sp.]